MRYKVFISDPSQHFIRLEWTIENATSETIHIQLPAWRPGRYELQNYAKNIRGFEVKNEKNEPVSFLKETKDCWKIEADKSKKIIVVYEYYANQYDAGASYVDASLLYLNPVNCFMYVVGKMDVPFEIQLEIPDDYKIACQLPIKGKNILAKTFDELADSPFIASPILQQHSFKVNQSDFHFWFQGKHEMDVMRLEEETRIYALKQIEMFGEFPCKAYHFLYHFLDRPFRHGVEHSDSTVITMGKSPDQTDEEFYNDLLAISCHELFHIWNVKRIRPADMLPYDFTKENYSTLGYVYEGVTTYYGDLLLLRSGVWTWEQYASSFASDLKRHLDNPGRFNYSVAESSFDTWLDGYVAGIPGRKTSIYIEGLLAAFIADVMIIRNSGGKYSLGNVMKSLYDDFYLKGRGYTDQDYFKLIEKYSGGMVEKYVTDIISGKGNFEKYLMEATDSIGCQINFTIPGIQIKTMPTENENNMFLFWSGIKNHLF